MKCTTTADGICLTSRQAPDRCTVHNPALRTQRRPVRPVAATPYTLPVLNALPCDRRGERISTIGCGSCSGQKSVAVFECALHEECTLTDTADGVRCCLGCTDRIVQPPPSKPVHLAAVAVVIVCHDYGRFLADAINSVLAQTHAAAEILVVDDSSTDNTATVAASLPNVKYLRGEWRHPLHARIAGMRATVSPLLCFLDADDYLADDYLAQGAALFAEPTVGVAWSDIQEFGDSNLFRTMEREPLTRRNYVHAGALVRRSAIELLDPESIDCDRDQVEDWLLWRLLDRDRWEFRKSASVYHYRRHPQGRSQTMLRDDWHRSTPFAHEQLTLFVPLSGRSAYWSQFSEFLDRQTFPHERISLLLCDTSGCDKFNATVRQWAAGCGYADVRVYRQSLPVPRGVADADRRDIKTARQVQLAVGMIYRRLLRELTTDYVWVIEDDVIPPANAAELLWSQFGEHVASASGAYRSPYHEGYIAVGLRGERITRLPVEPFRVSCNGFGCVILRRECLDRYGITHTDPTGDFDRNFYSRAIADGEICTVHPLVECEHLGISDR
jgi:hypothetical protein